MDYLQANSSEYRCQPITDGTSQQTQLCCEAMREESGPSMTAGKRMINDFGAIPLQRRETSRAARYGLAAGVAATAALSQWLIHPWVGMQIPFLFFLPALMYSALLLGRGPASTVLLLGGLNAALSSPPIGRLSIDHPQDIAAVVAYSVVGMVVIFWGDRMRTRSMQVRLAERRLAVAQEYTGIGVFELDFAAGTAYVSPSLCQILGQPVSEGPIGLDRWLNQLHAGHVEESRRAMQDRLAQGELRYEREQQIELSNGEVRWLLHRVRLEAGPDGRLLQARGATVDITARKELDAALQLTQARLAENEKRFSVALESSIVPFNILSPVRDDAGKIVDFQWTYLNAAAAAALGRTLDELRGARIGDVLPKVWETEGLFERYVGVVERGEQCEFEVRSVATGRGGWFNVVASPLQGSAAVWFANITDRKLREQGLHDADRRKDEFLATLAHELRNPLAPIRQSVRIAKSATATEAQRQWSHDIIERQVQGMSLLLDDLLDLSRVGRGSLLLRKSEVDLATLVETAVETARPHFEAKRHRLEVALPDSVVSLQVDPLRIAQVLGNLLTNAAKYTEPGGRIRLSASLEADDLVVCVSDNGIGMTAAQTMQVFELFAQIPAAIEKSQGGLGIGLALVRGLVELHGGSVTASSPGPGRGTQMTVRLPGICPDRSEFDQARLAKAVPARFSGSVRRILIADDNVDAADSLAELFRLDGHEVHVAYDGGQALELFSQADPDVALLDIGMPGLSGIEVARAIRSHNPGHRATLIAVTGWGQDADRRAALNSGFDHHLTKPVQPEQIEALIAADPLSPLAH
jgi:PAS domain S-box-containing protein